MTETDKLNYYRIVTDCWRLFLKFQCPVSATEYWENLCVEAKTVAGRYGNTRFVESLVLTVLEEIGRIWDARQKCRSRQAYT
ncbi:MAG: hypothetical protein ACI4CZ_06225 [Hominisplanchenecus sp.]